MIGNVIFNIKIVLLIKLNDNELVNVLIMIINIIVKIIFLIIRLYFFFLVGVNGLVGFILMLFKFLWLKSIYYIKFNVILIVVIKNLLWKFLILIKCCKIIGDNNVFILIDIQKIIKFVFICLLFLGYKWLMIFEMFGFIKFELIMMKNIDVNKLINVNGKFK